MERQGQKVIIGIISIALFVVAFFSLFLVVKDLHHDCIGDDCPICAVIHQSEEILNLIKTGISAILAIVIVQFHYIATGFTYLHLAYVFSLISCKVRMNN